MMVEENEVNELKKTENEKRRSGWRLGRSAIAAILVLMIAFGVTFFVYRGGKIMSLFSGL